ncbi:protein kinase [bacterium]|nr:protein kinase [bacterium]
MNSAVSTNLQPGTVLGTRYRIESVLGHGGMGAVYLGRIDALNKPVAIKEMRVQASDEKRQNQAIDQFRQEAHFLANLDHPNLVQVTDFFVEDNRYYLVMAYVKGQNLSEVMQSRRGTLPVAQVLEWALQLASVLTYLHNQEPPILFRDLKPSNIMLDNAGNVRLIDFGIARSFNPDQATATFLQGMGSAGYAPLEQYQGAGGTDPRSDIYALGATLFHLLTNKVPASPIELVATGAGAPSAQKLNPMIPPALDKVISKMMGLRKDERYQSMEQVRSLLDQISKSLQEPLDMTENLALPVAPPPPVTAPPIQAPLAAASPASGPFSPSVDSGGVALWVTAGGLCVAALSLFGWMYLQAQPQPKTAASPVPRATAAVASQPPAEPKRPVQKKPPKTQPVAASSSPPVERPRPVSSKPVVRPPVVEPEVPALPGSHYPTAATRPKPSPSPNPDPVVAQNTPFPDSSTSSGAPQPQTGGIKGWWGNHPGWQFAPPDSRGWVQDNKGSWHPPEGAPEPRADQPLSKVGGDRVKE